VRREHQLQKARRRQAGGEEQMAQDVGRQLRRQRHQDRPRFRDHTHVRAHAGVGGEACLAQRVGEFLPAEIREDVAHARSSSTPDAEPALPHERLIVQTFERFALNTRKSQKSAAAMAAPPGRSVHKRKRSVAARAPASAKVTVG
jgi:hypothetical protein